MSKEINIPLTWEEIDAITISLRLTNQAFKGNIRDELEEKISNYSMIAKQANNKQTISCKEDCIYSGRPTYKFPCDKCIRENFKFYKNKE